MAMTLVSTTTVPSGGAASIEFTNIPQTGKDLLLILSARASGGQAPFMALNSNTSAGRTVRLLEGNGSAVSSYSVTGVTSRGMYLGETNWSSTTANTFAAHQAYISNYTGSANKSISIESLQENNATTAYAQIHAGLYEITSAITSMTLQLGSTDTFVQHSTASLYIIS